MDQKRKSNAVVVVITVMVEEPEARQPASFSGLTGRQTKPNSHLGVAERLNCG